jgi:hypothetical protein
MDFLILVDFDILYQILSHSFLIVLSENHLCELGLSQIESDESQFQFVRVRQAWVHFVWNSLKSPLISQTSLADSQSRNLESHHSQAQANLCRTSNL